MNDIGKLDILNCGMGHLEITYKMKDPMEMERAKRIIGDMLKRGYALFVHGKDKALIRVKRFDPKHNTFIIADGPTVPAEAVPMPLVRGRRKEKVVAVPIAKTHATVVARSAGG